MDQPISELPSRWRGVEPAPVLRERNSAVGDLGALSPRGPLLAALLLGMAVLVSAPLTGWLPVVRLPAVVVPCLLLAGFALRMSRWRAPSLDALSGWSPSLSTVVCAAVASTAILGWIVLTRFWSGEINGVDFTVYFDRPCFQTMQGRPLFVETADDPRFANQGQLAQHAYWGMFLLCAPYAVKSSPYWLLAVSVLAPVLGAVYLLRLTMRLGAGGVLASATALAFLLNDNTARALNYGFHPELLYAWFIPWMMDAGLRRARVSFLAAAAGCLLVKEDAFLAVFAVSAVLALHRWNAMNRADRWIMLALPVAAGLVNLAAYYLVLLPRLTGDTPIYVEYWAEYGSTPASALAGMVAAPARVLAGILTSGFWGTVMLPHLFLPIGGWRWMVGAVPIVILYSASTSEQVRTFSIYYAMVLVPFLTVAALMGALSLARRLFSSEPHARLAAASILLLGALLAGSGSRGYSLRPWRQEVARVSDALARVADEPVVLVQSGLYPHVGYDSRLQLLTPAALADPRSVGAAVLLAPRLGAFPFAAGELKAHGSLRTLEAMQSGVVLARVK